MTASVDTLLAGMQQPVFYTKVVTPTPTIGRALSLWTLNGHPGAGSFNGTLGGATYSSTSTIPAGALYHVDPTGGLSAYLSKFIASFSAQSFCVTALCDRIWDNLLTINSGGTQTINSPAWPNRDQNGTSNGFGVQLAVEVEVACSSTAARMTCSYTNSAGTASKTAAFLDLPAASVNVIGTFYRLQLAAGDQGVKSIQSAVFSTFWVTGTVHLVAYRPIAYVLTTLATMGVSADPMSGGFPQLYNGVTPFIIILPNVATAGIMTAFYQEVWT